jgi:hypothetical protein
VQVTFVVFDHEIFLQSFELYLEPAVWHVQKFQFLVKMQATGTGKVLDSLPRNYVAGELCSSEFIVVYCRDPE